jgi:hypothetical protein
MRRPFRRLASWAGFTALSPGTCWSITADTLPRTASAKIKLEGVHDKQPCGLCAACMLAAYATLILGHADGERAQICLVQRRYGYRDYGYLAIATRGERR